MPAPPPQPLALDRKAMAILALVTFVVFWFTTGNGFIDLDDDYYILKNPHVFSGLSGENIGWALSNYNYFYWQPLTWITHMIDVEVYGLKPFGHHLTNVVLHSVNACLFYWALLRLSGQAWASVLLAAVFALHPLRVESVAWVAERKDLLSAGFWLLSLILYEEYARTKSKTAYGRTILAMALGLASKPTVVTLPFVFLLFDVWPLRRAEGWAQRLMEKIPMFGLAVVSSVITFIGQREAGAVADLGSIPLATRFGNAIQSYAKYLGKMVWPHPLAVFYPYKDTIDPLMLGLAVVVLAAVTGACWWQWKPRPYLLIGWLYYLGTFVPTIGFVQAGMQSMADRFTYIPMLGLLLALACLVGEFGPRQWLYVIPVVCAAVSFQQIGYWKDTITLFEQALALDPVSPIVRNNLGNARLEQKNYAEAALHFREAVKAWPQFYRAKLNLALAIANQKDVAQALQLADEVIRDFPAVGEAYYTRGAILMDAGRGEEAVPVFERSLGMVLRPDQAAHAHTNIGAILAQKRELVAAEQHFRAALARVPTFVPAHRNLANVLVDQGRPGEAINGLTAAVRQTQSAELAAVLRQLQNEVGLR